MSWTGGVWAAVLMDALSVVSYMALSAVSSDLEGAFRFRRSHGASF